MNRKTDPGTEEQASSSAKAAKSPRKGGGWQEIEARREKAELKASLADVWDEDFDLDDEVLADLDHNAEFFTSQEDEEVDFDEDGEADEFFDDDSL